MRTRRLLILLSAVIATVALVAGCGSDDKPTLRVMAAASMEDVLVPLKAAYGDEYEDIGFQVDLAASSELVARLKSGAEANVLITANERTMAQAVANGDVTDPVAISTNTLVIVVPKGNPGKVTDLASFAALGDEAIICASEVPCGTAAEEALSAIGATPPAARAINVRDALGKVTSGEMDAALVYRTDATSAGDKVETIEFENAPVVTNMAAAVNDEGKDFVALLTSEKGRAIFAEYGFGLP